MRQCILCVCPNVFPPDVDYVPATGEVVIEGYKITIEDNIATFTAVEDFMSNTEVMIEFSSNFAATDGTTLGTETSMWFTTSYYPVIITPTMVRLTEGLQYFLTEVPDDTIWRTILKNTYGAISLWNEGKGFPYGNPPWCVKEFILFTTVLDLLTYGLFLLNANSGTKTLADLTIDNNGPGSVQNILNQQRADLIDKINTLHSLVMWKCVGMTMSTGIRGMWDEIPAPIMDYDVTWKRYPNTSYDSGWFSMYPSAIYKNMSIREAYSKGKVNKFNKRNRILET